MRRTAAMLAVLCSITAGCSRQDTEKAKVEARQAAREADAGLHKAGQEIKSAVNNAHFTDADRKRRTEYQDQMQARLDRLDREIDELKTRANHATGARKAELERRIADLEQQRADVRSKYSNLKGAADDVWEKMKAGVDQAADKLQEGFEKLKSDLKS